MKSLLCCVAAFAVGQFLLEIESVWAGVAGLVVLPLMLAWPASLFLNWLIPLPKEE